LTFFGLIGQVKGMDGLDLTIGDAAAGLTGYRIKPTPPRRRSPWQRFTRLFPFIIVVIIPTAVVSAYYVWYAADQFTSEAKFVVRGPNTAAPGMISSLLQSAGVGRAQDDTYAVQDYILSRDALGELVKNDDLTHVFARPEADELAKFPPLFQGTSFEHLYKYYLSHVDVELDSTTGVSTLTVKTFRPGSLLAGAERLVNRMNDRQRDNAMRDARKEIGLAEKRVQSVAADIASFRNREEVLDPTKQSVPMLQGIFELQQMLVRTKIQIAQLTASSPHSPLLADYQQRVIALQAQIDNAKTKVTGTDSSLVPKIMAYDMLTLQREFADKALASATGSLEAARIEAERQQLYLDPIVAPNKADYPAYPKKISSISIVFFSLLGAYCLLALIIAGAREHKVV
jgi:capsular polysaccharide transport system permease protein